MNHNPADHGYTPWRDARDMLAWFAAWFAASVIVLGLSIWIVGCAGIVQQPADPVTTARIRAACMADGVFRDMGGRLVLSMIPVPGVATADRIIGMGIDVVCADPERFSADISTVEWVIRNLRG